MTNERAIELLNRISDSQFDGIHGDERREALEMAVRALEQNLVQESGGLVKDLVKDCISRQQAIDALGDEPEVWSGKDEYAQGLNNQWHYDRNAIKALPSVHPNLKGAKFEIICSQRQTGRTTKLIEKCAGYRYALIVCPSRMRASYIFHYARKMGKHIPMPMTFGDFLQGRFAAEHIDAFLIDDLDSCLANYSRNVPIDTVVFEGRAEE